MIEPAAHITSQIVATVNRFHRFLVVTHVRPDGDAIGSLLAMTTMLRKLDKEVHPYCQDAVPEGQDFLPGAAEIRHSLNDDHHYEVAFLVDCGEFQRVGTDLARAIEPVPVIINIDHHISNAPFGTVCWVDPSASSTCEMLYELSKELGIALDPALATQLYTGLLTDTGSFRFSNTTHRVLAVATELVAAGAQPAEIAEHIYESAAPQRLHLLSRVLATVQYRMDERLAFAELTLKMIHETGSQPADSEGFINLLRSVRPVRVAVLFREGEDGLTHVSLRSKGMIDVAAFARRHGGGGHRNAAAFRVKGALQAVRDRVIHELEDFLR